jgi:hypothetical protein
MASVDLGSPMGEEPKVTTYECEIRLLLAQELFTRAAGITLKLVRN